MPEPVPAMLGQSWPTRVSRSLPAALRGLIRPDQFAARCRRCSVSPALFLVSSAAMTIQGRQSVPLRTLAEDVWSRHVPAVLRSSIASAARVCRGAVSHRGSRRRVLAYRYDIVVSDIQRWCLVHCAWRSRLAQPHGMAEYAYISSTMKPSLRSTAGWVPMSSAKWIYDAPYLNAYLRRSAWCLCG